MNTDGFLFGWTARARMSTGWNRSWRCNARQVTGQGRWYKLDFSGFGGLSGGIGHKLRQPFVDRPRLFRSARSRPPSRTIIPPQDWAHRLVRPEYPSDGGEAVGEGRVRVLVPRRAKDRQLAGPRRQFPGPQRHQREQPEQQRRGALDRQIRPLPLGL